MTVTVIQCPTCGAPTSENAGKCEYCNNFLIHLTSYELHTTTNEKNENSYFRSLKTLYKTALITGITTCLLIYIVFFNLISETILILISPIWFLLLHFGISGLYTEKAIEAIIQRKAENFNQGLSVASSDSTPMIKFMMYITLIPVMLVFGFKNVTSPLKLALKTTLIWSILLYLFFAVIFPTL